MCFFNCVLFLYFHCFWALLLKLHSFCSSYAPSLLLFYGDFYFLFYYYGEVITCPEFTFIALFWGYCRFAAVKCSLVGFFFFVNAQEIVFIFSLPHNGLCVLKSPSRIFKCWKLLQEFSHIFLCYLVC